MADEAIVAYHEKDRGNGLCAFSRATIGNMETKRAPLDPAIELDMPAVCAAIERERVRRSISHVQVARELGAPLRTMANWRQGISGMNGSALLKVCLWTGRSIESFARQIDPPATKTEAA